MARDRARGLEDGAGPSGGGVGEQGIFNHRLGTSTLGLKFRAWGSGGDGI